MAHSFVSRERRKRERFEAYLPVKFDPWQDAQLDWCKAEAEQAEEPSKSLLVIGRGESPLAESLHGLSQLYFGKSKQLTKPIN